MDKCTIQEKIQELQNQQQNIQANISALKHQIDQYIDSIEKNKLDINNLIVQMHRNDAMLSVYQQLLGDQLDGAN